MGSNTRYSAINTKISTMYGKLLKEEDYRKIISLKNPTEIAVYLKNNTAYGEFFKDKDPTKMHRTEIEQILKQGLITYMDKVIHYFNGEYRNFIKCFYIKYEITDIKKVARMIHIDKDFADLRDNLLFAGKYRYIDMDKVITSKSISELIGALKDTIYYPFLKNLWDEDAKESLYKFEMSIDKAYFYILEDSVEHL
ncbi:MAG: V-type ATPase subunit, partial [Clostridiales bacterium]|nr:V-type ATPase subunit [Clostridiales bacterium]